MLKQRIAGSFASGRPAHRGVAAFVSNSVSSVGRRSVPLFISLFLIGLVVPIQIHIGPLRLSPYRIVLIAAVIPCLILLISRKVGRIQPTDILIVLSACWAALALLVVHGVEDAIEASGIHWIETVGAYLVGRCFIRDRADFVGFVRLLFRIVVVLLPFAIHEALTGQSLLLAILGSVAPVVADTTMDGRLGLERAQVSFEHPILYGVFCASAFALTWYVLGFRQSATKKLTRSGLVILATFFSLSAGAFAALIVQAGLIGWEFLTRGMQTRWRLLSFLCVTGYFAIDFLSNRTPFHVLVTYLTFNVHSAYSRILIWEYGSAEVWRHPLFGIGLGEWERPEFMPPSIDNFWLVIAVRYGIPAFVLLVLALLLGLRSLGRMPIADLETKNCRMGILVTLGGLIMAGTTVHYWNATYCLFLFLLGSGMWMLTRQKVASTKQGPAPLPRPNLPWLRSRTARRVT